MKAKPVQLQRQSKRLWRTNLNNLPLKIISILGAIMLYMFANSQTNSSVISLVVPIEVLNVPKEKVILLPDIRQAQVSFKGPSFLVREVAMSAPAFRVSLPDTPKNREVINLSDQSLTVPPGVDIVSIEPPELELFLDNLITKNVTVQIPIIGKLNSDYKLVKITPDPENINITGSQTEIRSIKSIQTLPLDLRDIKESTSKILKLRNLGKFSKTNVDVIKADVEVEVIKIEKTFKDIPIKVVGSDINSLNLSPKKVDIEISGPKSKVLEIKKEELLPYVNFDTGKPEGTYKVNLELSEGLELIIIIPDKINISNIKKSLRSKEN